jgi:hypothetical protein
MTKSLKTSQSALYGFVGYGGTRFPHVDQRPFIQIENCSRVLMVGSLLKVIARPVDWFLCCFYLLWSGLCAVAFSSVHKPDPRSNTGGNTGGYRKRVVWVRRYGCNCYCAYGL